MTTKDRIFAFCEEYTDFILYDSSRGSFVLNFDKKYLRQIHNRFTSCGYVLKHSSGFSHTENITCVYIKD